MVKLFLAFWGASRLMSKVATPVFNLTTSDLLSPCHHWALLSVVWMFSVILSGEGWNLKIVSISITLWLMLNIWKFNIIFTHLDSLLRIFITTSQLYQLFPFLRLYDYIIFPFISSLLSISYILSCSLPNHGLI